MTVIEFMGLPGSGKSTLARALATALCGQGVHVVERRDELAGKRIRHLIRARFALAGWLLRPRDMLRGFRLIVQDGQPSVYSYAKVTWILWNTIGWYALVQRKAQIVIVDQGLIQAVWSIRLKSIRTVADWLSFLKAMNVIDGIVMVKASAENASDRLKLRELEISRLSNTSAEDPLWQVGKREMGSILATADQVAPLMSLENDRYEQIAPATERLLLWTVDLTG